mgnify:CR=1 FL=1
MELLGLATYEIRGGEKAEVFIRINDPEKIETTGNKRKIHQRGVAKYSRTSSQQ